PACVRLQGSRDDLDERRLAGAAVAHDAGDLIRVDLEVHVLQGGDVAESLRDTLGLEHRHGSGRFAWRRRDLLGRSVLLLRAHRSAERARRRSTTTARMTRIPVASVW